MEDNQDPGLAQASNAKLGGAYGPSAQAATGAKILSRDPDTDAQPNLMLVPVGDAKVREKGATKAADDRGPYGQSWSRFKVAAVAAAVAAAFVWFMKGKA